MGCSISHFENEGDYFLDKIYSSFPLKTTTFETFEDCYEKYLGDYVSVDNFYDLFKKKFDREFKDDNNKNYHLLILEYILRKLTPISNNYELFKYNFFLFLFPFLNHDVSREEVIDNFKEIIIYLCDFKKSQLEIVKNLQNILFTFFFFVVYEIPEMITIYITNTNNDDTKFLIFLKNKLNFFNRKKIDNEVNRIINNFFANMKKNNLNDSLNRCFNDVSLDYYYIQKFFY
jgi:hypothetical protein